MASVEKRGKTFTVRYRTTDDTGKTEQKRASGYPTEAAAWADAARLESTSAAGIDIHADKMTCGELMIKWMAEHCEGNLAGTTIEKYNDGMINLAKTFAWNLQVRKMTNLKFRALLKVLKTLNSEKPMSDRTAITKTEPLRLSISWAFGENILPINPLGKIKLPKVSNSKQVIINDEDVGELVSLLAKKPFRIPFLLGVHGGLRREEAAALRWDCVDFKRNTITILEAQPKTISGKRIQKDPKSDASSRTISMPSKIMAVLKAIEKKNVYVCVSSNGQQYALDSFPAAVHRVIAQANKSRLGTDKPPIPDACFHDLRHTHAAHLIKLGIQPKVIQERLGHSSIKITMDLYGYLMTGIQEGVADILDAKINI